jgi:hypothetical protein
MGECELDRELAPGRAAHQDGGASTEGRGDGRPQFVDSIDGPIRCRGPATARAVVTENLGLRCQARYVQLEHAAVEAAGVQQHDGHPTPVERSVQGGHDRILSAAVSNCAWFSLSPSCIQEIN